MTGKSRKVSGVEIFFSIEEMAIDHHHHLDHKMGGGGQGSHRKCRADSFGRGFPTNPREEIESLLAARNIAQHIPQ